MTAEQKRILQYWRDIEIFNLPEPEEESSLLTPDKPLPWKEFQENNSSDYTWRYTLFFGKIEKKDVVGAIERQLGDDPDNKPDWVEPVTGTTCIAALVLDQSGRPDEKSYIQASYIHGLGCLSRGTPVSAVRDLLEAVQPDFEERYKIPMMEDGEDGSRKRKGPEVDWTRLTEEWGTLKSLCEEAGITCPEEIYCLAREVPRDSDTDTSFLNSFYLDDLNRLIEDKAGFGQALSQYLRATPEVSRRTDVLADKNELIKCVDPSLMPAGRWPSDIRYGLYTAQQAAVNTALAGLEKGAGILGINGPPGTGKTTLLLDVVAGVIVSRAARMLNYSYDQLFDSKYNKIDRDGGFSGYYWPDQEVFYSSGIVVASNNNAAVENITREIPAAKKIDRKSFPDASYFSEQATRLITEETWGILGAALGNAKNRNSFKWTFWENGNGYTGFRQLLHSVYKDKENDRTAEYGEYFDTAKEELRQLLEEFQVFKDQASQVHKKLYAHLEDLQTPVRLQQELETIQEAISRIQEAIAELHKPLEDLNQQIASLQQTLHFLQANKPGWYFWQKLFKTTAYKAYHASIAAQLDRLQPLEDQRSILTSTKQVLSSELNDQNKRNEKLQKKCLAAIKSIERYQQEKLLLCERYGIAAADIVDETFYGQDLSSTHIRTPYSSPRINDLRSRILLKSLELHQYAILSNAKYFRNNLSLFMDCLNGRAEVSPKLAVALWNSFFFCVPVISTTLASVSRLFTYLGKEDLGWLLLDEAGQATPQSALGMIWRSRRCIIIGDPLQIEPVVTIPQKLAVNLATQNRVDGHWSPRVSSVQNLADRVSLVGTHMQSSQEDEPVWTGFPLRTHRRCNDPMFSIANAIAYSGQMVRAIPDQPFEPALGPSTWFHVAGVNVYSKQVVKEETDLLKDKIRRLAESGYKGHVFVISPFRSIAAECWKKVGKKSGALTVACGTIHTFQGKETDIVFLVLGSNPASPGAREWASAKPNLLNVALTRARRRIYVIGNRNLWGKCPYFNALMSGLPYEVNNVLQQ